MDLIAEKATRPTVCSVDADPIMHQVERTCITRASGGRDDWSDFECGLTSNGTFTLVELYIPRKMMELEEFSFGFVGSGLPLEIDLADFVSTRPSLAPPLSSQCGTILSFLIRTFFTTIFSLTSLLMSQI